MTDDPHLPIFFSNGQMVGRRGSRKPSTSSEPYSRKVMGGAHPNLRRHRSTQAIQACASSLPRAGAEQLTRPAGRQLFFKAAEIVKPAAASENRRHSLAPPKRKHGSYSRRFQHGSGDRKVSNRRPGWVYNTPWRKYFPSKHPRSHSFSNSGRPLGVVASPSRPLERSEHYCRGARALVAFGGGQHDRDETLGARANLRQG